MHLVPGVAAIPRPTARSASNLGEASSAEPVRYLPPLNYSVSEPLEVEVEGDSLVLPCFLLGKIAYTPESKQVLNIFEPRYREMYDDILFSGGRRFVVAQVKKDEDTGRHHLAEVGVVFYLDELQEVSEQTNDKVKYVCSHSVISRVRLKRVLNPRAFADRSTYLRVEAEEVVDIDATEDLRHAEDDLMGLVLEVADLQKTVEPSAMFQDDSLLDQNATRAGFWDLVVLWQNALNLQIRECQRRFEQQLRERLLEFFDKAVGNIPQQISLRELPDELQKEVIALQEEFQDEISPLEKAQAQQVQVLLQSSSHMERLQIFSRVLEEDRTRLEARLAVKAVLDAALEAEP